MTRHPTSFEWHIAQDEEEWARLCHPANHNSLPPLSSLSFTRYLQHGIIVLLVLVLGLGGWFWQNSPGRYGRTASQIEETVQAEMQAVDYAHLQLPSQVTDRTIDPNWQLHFIKEANQLRQLSGVSEYGQQLSAKVETLSVQEDQAIATVVMSTEPQGASYRQTRFYRHAVTQWVRTAPDAELWGPPHRLETTFFVFYFHQHDAATVAAVAPVMDALYARMRYNLGLVPRGGQEKTQLIVDPTQPPGEIESYLRYRYKIVVPSPVLYLAPVELSDEEILTQSLTWALLEALLREANYQYDIREIWQPLLEGLRLWQLWDANLPLGHWRTEVVKWLFVDQQAGALLNPAGLPKHYAQLCAIHSLWMAQPTAIGIPTWCQRRPDGRWYTPPSLLQDPPLSLAELSVPLRDYNYTALNSQSPNSSHPSSVVALATLIEYIVATWGHDRLSLFMAGLAHYRSWEQLVPAVFDISASEFEAGWQQHLVRHYGVTHLPTRA